MKKSILLSATIMLIILFVALTTTTFAWYQASAGEITLSGSSTASVTTTGPDSPYLVIANSTSTNVIEGKTLSQVVSDDYASNTSALTTISVTPTNELQLAYPSNTSTPAFTSPVTGDTISLSDMYKFVVYVKNTSESFTLTCNAVVNNSGTALTSDYAYLIFVTATDKANQVVYSAYKNNVNGDVSASATSLSFDGGVIYTITVYMWINNNTGLRSSESVHGINVIPTPRLVLSNVGIPS